MNIAYLVAAVLYFALVMGVGLFTAKGETREEFLIGDRQYSTLLLAASVGASWLTGAWIVIIFGMVSTDLTTLLSMGLAFPVCLMAFSFAGPRLRDLAVQHNAHSMTEMVEKIIGGRASLVCAGIVLILYFGWLLMEMVGAAKLLSAFSGWSYQASVLTLAGVITTYLWAGGFQALMRTDLLQAIFVLLLFGLIFFLPAEVRSPDWSTLGEGQTFTFSGAVGGFTLGVVATFAAAELWQRMIAARSASAARWGIFWAGPVVFLMTAFLFYIGFGVYKLHPDAAPEQYFPLLIESMPGILGPLLFLSLMALVMSTLDTIGFVTAQTLMNDGIYKITGKKVEHPRQALKTGIIVTFIGSAVLALTFTNVIEILFFLFAYWSVLTPVLFIILKTPPSEKSIVISIIIGLLTVAGLQITGAYQDWMNLITACGLLILPPVLDKILTKVPHTGTL